MRLISRCTILCILAGLFCQLPLWSENAADSAAPVTIREINTEIEGKTRRGALLNELRIKEGREYESLQRLEDVLDNRAKKLMQRRLFKDFVWKVESPEPGIAIVDISIVDSATLLPRPMVKYASDTGLLLGLKIEYFNAFGSLTDQIIEAYWSPAEMRVRLDVNNISMGPLHFNVAYEQFDGVTRYGNPRGDIVAEFNNSHSEASILADWQLGETSAWSYYLEPHFLWQYNFRSEYKDSNAIILEKMTLDSDYLIIPGFSPGFFHGIFTDQVEWVGNFRKGFEFSLMNENTWYLESDRNDILFESDLYGFLPLSSWFEISGRLGGFYAIEGTREEAGDRLRGVVDFMTYGYWGVFGTAQMNFKLIPDDKFLSVQVRPFVDAGYVRSRVWDAGPDSWEYCVGGTLIFFLRPLPSLNFNIEYGWDFKRDMPEVIIGTTLLF